jgi:peptidoglycan/xylan/chitin deacetylase (PgdA/CDA1 family)
MTFEALHVRARELEAHCRLIRKSCHPIRLSTWLDSGGSTPARPVLVTFDDGYRSVFTLAKPILEKYEIPAVVFITSRPAIERRKFWYDEMAAALGESSVEEAKSSPYRLWAQKLAALPANEVADDDPHAPLRPEEIRALAAHPLFEIGGHSSTHPILSRAGEEVQRHEIEGNRRDLESLTGVSPRAFAYPNGRPANDYDDTSLRLVREAGYETAFTTAAGFSLSSESRWERSRFLMLAGISDAELGHRLSYSWTK